MDLISMLLCDYYKTDHRRQYPPKTEFVYSNWTGRYPRDPRYPGYIVFGLQYLCQRYFIEHFNRNFFKLPKYEVLDQFKRRMDTSLGPNQIGLEHVAALHDYGKIPVRVKALPEGTLCPFRVPAATFRNTHKDFYWVTNFLETLISNVLWLPMQSATTAFLYRKMLDSYARETSDIPEFVDWQGHDFSMRGHSSLESSIVSGAGHLLSFTGTDTIPAIDFLEKYYFADAEREMIGGSVPATEHSVMCLGGKETEAQTYRRLLTEVYPHGIVSIVSDTWDYWKVLTDTIPSMKDAILARDGKLVVRPDSGDPVKIICGHPDAYGEAAQKGTVQVLWETFGGTVNSKGFKQLDPHIGVIYGDSITFERATQICALLQSKGFASTNVVFGIGSYTYQYVTRDTLGFAMKATWGVIDGKPVSVQKTPKTDDGVKNSAKGLLAVHRDDSGAIVLKEQCTDEEEAGGMLETVFDDGMMWRAATLAEIRKRVREQRLV